jgi:hypothetical protein
MLLKIVKVTAKHFIKPDACKRVEGKIRGVVR